MRNMNFVRALWNDPSFRSTFLRFFSSWILFKNLFLVQSEKKVESTWSSDILNKALLTLTSSFILHKVHFSLKNSSKNSSAPTQTAKSLFAVEKYEYHHHHHSDSRLRQKKELSLLDKCKLQLKQTEKYWNDFKFFNAVTYRWIFLNFLNFSL